MGSSSSRRVVVVEVDVEAVVEADEDGGGRFTFTVRP